MLAALRSLLSGDVPRAFSFSFFDVALTAEALQLELPRIHFGGHVPPGQMCGARQEQS